MYQTNDIIRRERDKRQYDNKKGSARAPQHNSVDKLNIHNNNNNNNVVFFKVA